MCSCETDYLDTVSGELKCCSKYDCIYKLRGIIAGKVCMTRESWVQKNSLNFIGLNMTGLTYDGPSIDVSQASSVCKVEGGYAAGAELKDGICVCPQGTYYPSQSHMCTQGDPDLNQDQLLLRFEYTYNDRHYLY